LCYNEKYIYPSTLSVILEHMGNVQECQFAQKKKDVLIIRIVKRKEYSQDDTDTLRKNIQWSMGGPVSIKFEFVESIPRTKMGKYQLVKNEMGSHKSK